MWTISKGIKDDRMAKSVLAWMMMNSEIVNSVNIGDVINLVCGLY